MIHYWNVSSFLCFWWPKGSCFVQDLMEYTLKRGKLTEYFVEVVEIDNLFYRVGNGSELNEKKYLHILGGEVNIRRLEA